MKDYGIKTYTNTEEAEARGQMVQMLKNCPIPDDQLLSNLGLFLNSKSLSRILFMDHIYKQIVDVQGVIIEFGTRWGQNLALFSALRGIYEPFNRHRKIIGFDTFEGFPSISDKDGVSDMMVVGGLALPDNYVDYLENIITLQEKDNPLAHIKKHDLRTGDATEEIEKYLKDCPETIIALAYFDFDLYEPTKKCLTAIKDRLVKGSILGFDELNDPDSPGETLALMEVMGLNNIRLKRYRYTSRTSYYIVE
ncbi:crotonobetainyl-CoA--carnitine CoA-transferase [Heliobacillus mobilis]|uniref:Crotonobetainyl-CoA--carnitine CoA-transferase n=1 Tax=Heliobacterium mobile TaxID=28064 RepID=A0A6I3SL96_HELMO|nr:crotonobetainyl-CoA--carnitine CoA-transferase [Heliobacterium mobile]MTV49680.1 crotonobetainyl-CoA--carnitine CoA-transferase [Heliobacterium mobile]